MLECKLVFKPARTIVCRRRCIIKEYVCMNVMQYSRVCICECYAIFKSMYVCYAICKSMYV